MLDANTVAAQPLSTQLRSDINLTFCRGIGDMSVNNAREALSFVDDSHSVSEDRYWLVGKDLITLAHYSGIGGYQMKDVTPLLESAATAFEGLGEKGIVERFSKSDMALWGVEVGGIRKQLLDFVCAIVETDPNEMRLMLGLINRIHRAIEIPHDLAMSRMIDSLRLQS